MGQVNSRDSIGIVGRVTQQEYSTAELRERFDDWSTLSDSEKLSRLRDVEPEREQTTYNTTTERFHEYFVDNLDLDQTAAKDDVSVRWVGLGDDGAGGTSTSDTDLNNRVFSKQITDYTDNGTEFVADVFIDSNEANSETIDEIGLFTGDPSNLANDDVFLINHTTLNAVTKDNDATVIFSVTLSFGDT